MSTEPAFTRDPKPISRYIELGGIIARLEREDPARILPLGFANPHSFRGDYYDLAFEPVADISIGDMLAACRSALGATFQGWKGGDFTMAEHTDCWIATHGDDSDNKIGPLLLELLLMAGYDAASAARAALAAGEASCDDDDQWPPMQETYPGSGIYE